MQCIVRKGAAVGPVGPAEGQEVVREAVEVHAGAAREEAPGPVQVQVRPAEDEAGRDRGRVPEAVERAERGVQGAGAEDQPTRQEP